MKQIFLSLLMLGFVFSAAAQSKNNNNKGGKTPGEKATAMAMELKKDLGLTDDQYQKVYNAKLEKLNKKEAIKEKYGKDKQKAEPEMKQLHEDFKASMKSILTAEQYSTWSAKKDKKGRSATDDLD
jgi:hypothetical protein